MDYSAQKQSYICWYSGIYILPIFYSKHLFCKIVIPYLVGCHVFFGTLSYRVTNWFHDFTSLFISWHLFQLDLVGTFFWYHYNNNFITCKGRTLCFYIRYLLLHLLKSYSNNVSHEVHTSSKTVIKYLRIRNIGITSLR